MNIPDIWKQAQEEIKKAVGASSFETWFSSLSIKEGNKGQVVIEAPDEFFRSWIVDNYLSIIQEKLNLIAKTAVLVDIVVNLDLQKEPVMPSGPLPSEPFVQDNEGDKNQNLNSRFSFDNFIVGPSNRFCHAACLAVAESPAKAYNPLFIYSPVGLGKTHLMQSIAHKIKQNHPRLKCSYLSSESFTNELINAIRHRATDQFRQKFRHIDVLLIDDIHFIAGKESTQEEFFHTFNALHNSRKQIIISSDRPPKEISNLEERLSSRFAWGLITDIIPPDFETRVAILRKKLEREPVDVPDDVINFIAEQIRTNIRELEGALIRVVAYSLLEESPISLQVAKTVLKDMVKETVAAINVELVQKTVSDFFNIPLSDLKSKRRSKNIILPRQVAIYLSRKLTGLSLPEIGAAFGGKDHTTILHSCKKIDKDIVDNEDLKNTVEKIYTLIKG